MSGEKKYNGEVRGIKLLGHEFIMHGREAAWDALCDANMDDDNPNLLRQVMQVMTLLSKGDDFNHIFEFCDKGIAHSGRSMMWVLYQVAKYHPLGIRFAKSYDDPLIQMELEEEYVKLEEEMKAMAEEEPQQPAAPGV